MDSVPDILTDGFPHSEILGSKPVCRLPEAYRRLPRLSSPVAAKASTICAYSLDHITPSYPGHMELLVSRQCNIPRPNAFAFDLYLRQAKDLSACLAPYFTNPNRSEER